MSELTGSGIEHNRGLGLVGGRRLGRSTVAVRVAGALGTHGAAADDVESGRLPADVAGLASVLLLHLHLRQGRVRCFPVDCKRQGKSVARFRGVNRSKALTYRACRAGRE